MFDLRTLILVLWQRIWLILAVTALGTLAAIWGMIQIDRFPRYSATAVVAIGGDIYYNAQDTAYLELATAMLENYRRLAGLEIVTGAVARTLQLSESAHDFNDLLDVTPIENTNLLAIKAFYTDRQTAAAIANETARQLQALAPAQKRNFVLIVETAVPAQLPDVTAVIPIMMSATASLAAVAGVVLLITYIRQPILSESDLTTNLPLPVLAVVNIKKNNFVDWWRIKAVCEKHRQTKQIEPDRTHLRILITSPVATMAQAEAARQLAEIWQMSGEEAVVIEFSDRGKGERPSFPVTLTTAEANWQKAAPHPVTIFNTSPATDPISTLILAQRVDIILLLVPLRQTRLTDVQELLALFNSQGTTVDGIVLISGRAAGPIPLRQMIIRWFRRLRQGNGRFQNLTDKKQVVKTGESS